MKLLKFIHKIFKPNCQCMVCEAPHCDNCEELKRLLYQEQIDKSRLLDTIIKLSKDNEIQVESTTSLPEPIQPKNVPWPVKQRQLELADRAQAIKKREESEQDKITEKLIRDKTIDSKKIDELERELGVSDNAS